MQKNSPTAVLMSHHWKPFSICLMLAALLQLSGYNVFIYYSVIIFDTIAPDIMHPYDPSILSVCVMLLSYIFVLTVSYRLKRRHLLLISMVGMTGLHFILGKGQRKNKLCELARLARDVDCLYIVGTIEILRNQDFWPFWTLSIHPVIQPN